MTEYVVFQNVETGWKHVGPERVEARSARAAVSAALASRTSSADGTFVAIPVRSFKPVKVSVETKTALKFS